MLAPKASHDKLPDTTTARGAAAHTSTTAHATAAATANPARRRRGQGTRDAATTAGAESSPTAETKAATEGNDVQGQEAGRQGLVVPRL